MRAVLKTSSIVVLFVVLVCGQVLADGQPHLRGLPTDESVSVVSKPGKGSASPSDIKSCLTVSRSISVRFQKLKVKTATFTRTLLDGILVLTYASDMKTLSMNNIFNCANVAEAEGFVGFSFKLGKCDMFNMKYQPCGCQPGAKDVFYVQASFWDPKDYVLPQVVYGNTGPIVVFHLPSTVYDKQHLFNGSLKMIGPLKATSLSEQMQLNCASSLGTINCVCIGTDCFTTSFVDINHCVPKSCNAPGNTTIIQEIAFSGLPGFGLIPISKLCPIIYILSECGKTISLEPSFLVGENILLLRVVSHQGHGCQWYPKTGTDHECHVTITIKNRSSPSQYKIIEINLDQNTTTCKGDSLSVYNGASTNSTTIAIWDACTREPSDVVHRESTSSITFVFKRTATQYQENGFNWGFSIILALTLGV